MFRPRVIPVLLLKGQGLVKSIQFSKHQYIGDPINAVRIFNDLKADELVFLDILATKEQRLISLDFIKNVGEEANMPFAVGGGIRTLDDIREVIGVGAEKVIINSYAAENPTFIRLASDTFGSSTISVCIDVKKKMFGGITVWSNGGTKNTKCTPVDFAKQMEEEGAGELIIQSIERDGMMNGYDIELIRSISQAVTIPVVALGGAGSVDDLAKGYHEGYANGLAAGSMFVYQGKNRGVLINYPEKKDLQF
jgi:imidazole glycerol-phosphate synthase subunit HisF